MRLLLPIVLTMSTLVWAQSAHEPPLKFGEEVCPTYDNFGAAAHGGPRPQNEIPPFTLFPKGHRADVSAFGVQNEQGELITIRQHRGKLMVLAFWSYFCPGSMTELNEMLYLQANEKNETILFWPIHTEAWRNVLPFVRKERAPYKGSKLFKASMGEHGVHVLGTPITAYPMVFVIDRQGCIAASYAGYRAGRLLGVLKPLLAEP